MADDSRLLSFVLVIVGLKLCMIYLCCCLCCDDDWKSPKSAPESRDQPSTAAPPSPCIVTFDASGSTCRVFSREGNGQPFVVPMSETQSQSASQGEQRPAREPDIVTGHDDDADPPPSYDDCMKMNSNVV